MGPFLPKVAIWVLVLGWAAWIALQWLRDASATSVRPTVIQARPEIDLQAAIATAAGAAVFGEPEQGEANPTPVAAPLDIKLKGVFAGRDGPTAAIVNTGQDDEFALPGREVTPGVILEGIYPTHIVVGREGTSVRVELEPLKSPAPKSKAHPSTARSTHSPPDVPVEETEASPEPAAAESALPEASPMPQSEAWPYSLPRPRPA